MLFYKLVQAQELQMWMQVRIRQWLQAKLQMHSEFRFRVLKFSVINTGDFNTKYQLIIPKYTTLINKKGTHMSQQIFAIS